MKKIAFLIFSFILIVGVFGSLSFVLADDNSGGDSSGSDSSGDTSSEDSSGDSSRDDDLEERDDKDDNSGFSEEDRTLSKVDVRDDRVKREIERVRRFIDDDGNARELKIKIEEEIRDGILKRKIKYENDGRIKEIETRLELEEEEEDGRTRIRVRLSGGNLQDLEVLPDRVLEIVAAEIGSDNPEIELEESVVGDEIKAVYRVRAEKEGRFLGIFRARMNIETDVDSETGEIVRKRKPFWAFLVAGEENFEPGTQVVLCHIPRGDPDSAHTITVGGPAVRAHLAHGDHIGACEGDDGNQTNGNETGDDSDASQGLFIDILSPVDDFNYTNATILVELNSTGDEILFSINGGVNESYTGAVFREFVNGTNTLDAFASNSTNFSISESVEFEVSLFNVESNSTNGDTNSTSSDNNQTSDNNSSG